MCCWRLIFTSLEHVCSNPYTWLNSILAFCFLGTTIAFAGLWGVPFLRTTYGFSKTFSGFAISMIFVGWIIGGPIIGHISDKMGKRRPMLLLSTISAAIFLMLTIYVTLPISLIFIFLFLVGLFSSGELLSYSVAIEINPHTAKGTAVAFTNFIVFIGGAILQSFAGFLLDLHWAEKGIVHGIRVYSIGDYHFALMIFPITLFIAFILAFFLKEEKHETERSSYRP